MSNHPTEQMPDIGRVAEWIKAPHLKCDVGESLPWVRILPLLPCCLSSMVERWSVEPDTVVRYH